MAACCDSSGYDAVFGTRLARGLARRYRKRGLDRTARRMVDFLTHHGVEGASILEIGGGVGDLQVDLLRRGAARAVNLELVDAYDAPAADLAEEAGVAGRIERRILDIATDPEAVEPADVVILHRVVCCYPDHARLLRTAAGHARRLLVFSHPPRTLTNRAVVGIENAWHRLNGRTFRAYTHPTGEMLAVLTDAGLTPAYEHQGALWQVHGLTRHTTSGTPPTGGRLT